MCNAVYESCIHVPCLLDPPVSLVYWGRQLPKLSDLIKCNASSQTATLRLDARAALDELKIVNGRWSTGREHQCRFSCGCLFVEDHVDHHRCLNQCTVLVHIYLYILFPQGCDKNTILVVAEPVDIYCTQTVVELTLSLLFCRKSVL